MVSCWAHVTKYTILWHFWYSWFARWGCSNEKSSVFVVQVKWDWATSTVMWWLSMLFFRSSEVINNGLLVLWLWSRVFNESHKHTHIISKNKKPKIIHWIVVCLSMYMHRCTRRSFEIALFKFQEDDNWNERIKTHSHSHNFLSVSLFLAFSLCFLFLYVYLFVYISHTRFGF